MKMSRKGCGTALGNPRASKRKRKNVPKNMQVGVNWTYLPTSMHAGDLVRTCRSKIRKNDVDSEQSTQSSSKASNESRSWDECVELLEVEDDQAPPGPFCKVPAYANMEPGRYFTAGSDLTAPLKSSIIADLDSDANSTPFHVPRSSAGPRDWTAREATKQNVRFGPLLGIA